MRIIYVLLVLLIACKPAKKSSELSSPTQVKSSLSSKSVKDYGAKGDGVTNDSKAFIRAINSGYVFIPNGTYKVKNLPLNDELTVVAESNKAIVEGIAMSDVIFKSAKFAKNINFNGGTWRNANIIIQHVSERSLNSSSFQNMQIEDCNMGIVFTSSVGNSFQNLKFKNVNSGLVFGKNGQKNVHNVNHISGCKFMHFKDYGIYFENNNQKKSKNVIENCWLEQSPGTGIYLGNNCFSTVIQNTYFESLGSPGKGSDIIVGATKQSTVLGTKILNNTFKRSKAGSIVKSRVQVQGDSDLNAGGNEVNLLGVQKFIKFDNEPTAHSFLSNNQINQIGNARQKTASNKLSDQQRLFERTGKQKINYTIKPSGESNTFQEFKEGQIIQKVYPLSGAPTPSVSQGNIFTFSAGKAITNFQGGVEGLKIILVANGSRTIQNNRMISLEGGRAFTMKADQTLTLLFVGNKWIEISRKQ